MVNLWQINSCVCRCQMCGFEILRRLKYALRTREGFMSYIERCYKRAGHHVIGRHGCSEFRL